ncbi:MAG: TlyA family RNA methyltransferase [Elusimicrobia bacterium]|nr:TlyA family RNA methyltransferase [Candidatus Liberimonas magnetica]
MNKTRLDGLLVERSLATDTKKAQALIMAGLVNVDGKTASKAGTFVSIESDISILKKNPYVSRGGLKLEHALKHFKLDLADKVCLDIGASTGGFTDCMLQHGAKKVYAVDVGYNQLDHTLRKNPKVANIEGVNFRYFTGKNLKEAPEFVTIDVSFISLDKIIPVLINIVSAGTKILVMVKPQFEASAKEVIKGVVRDENIRLKAIEKIKALAIRLNLMIVGGIDSAVKGPKGNIEHFLLLEKL